MSKLVPPTTPIIDPGAHDLTDASDDHFSDASEGRHSGSTPSNHSAPNSPIPVTRVERVDDVPAHGEVPGTPAYSLRTHDAVPDEIEIVPVGQRSRGMSRVSEADRPMSPSTPMSPGGLPIPKTVVEKVEPDNPSHGEVPGTAAYEMRMADAQPDEVLKSPIEARLPLEGEPTIKHRSRSSGSSHSRSSSSRQVDNLPNLDIVPPLDPDGDGDGDGDDFDEFEEGFGDVEEAVVEDFDDDNDNNDDSFGDFGRSAQRQSNVTRLATTNPLQNFPSLHLDHKRSAQERQDAMLPYLESIFPDLDPQSLAVGEKTAYTTPEPLLSDRSASLWAQLIAPPPLQPPDWTRSRIRRLFLVSLGVPVDLDEILPASKQKKLMLPSTRAASTMSKRPSKSVPGKRDTGDARDRQATPPPEVDVYATRRLCSITTIALEAYDDDQLVAHVETLESILTTANTVLDYWDKRKQSALGDKEAFEGVIENLVGFMKNSKTSSKR